ncbi:ribbon-helix-helix domain-containing protein [Pseudonocardia sp. TRM90224]|uniref:ribbon-helix-helix domain-containing protein n=1 Tax=Pseudonocardia sp. TRM90224 TaxID=2812678 RepID=UPI001E60A015|nr:ribbon-helix-helix domain-containing protein [Pseudonocardia sp. TRM90224]
MTAERVTVSLPPDLLRDARSAVAGGAAESLSAFVAAALRTHLSRARALGELERVLGGRPPREAIDAVRRDLGLAPS